eukprot:gb/GEZN01008832.1/.p1 GENE.gb/GEZN01008832.1/~~gb/GEZN01008832.1/.p1  ORF type:complete len:359 (+),score=36.59 gb/GEZN01008832.1/:104-1180(+)
MGKDTRWKPVTSPLRIADIVIGGTALGNMYTASSDEEADECLRTALALGFRCIDTAPHYGLGLSETRIGRALSQATTAVRQDVKLWTKVGRVVVPRAKLTREQELRVEADCLPGVATQIFKGLDHSLVQVLDYSAAGARTSTHDSLARMQVERCYGLRVHDAESEEKLAEVFQPDGAFACLLKLQAENVCRKIGCGMNDPKMVARFLDMAPPKSVQEVMLAGCWNLIDQSGYSVLCKCEKDGVQVHLAGAFASGLLLGGNMYRYRPAPPEILRKRDAWLLLCSRHSVSIGAAALAFAWMPKCVSKVAYGVQTEAHVRTAAQLVRESASVPSSLWIEAQAQGLLDKSLALPIELRLSKL